MANKNNNTPVVQSSSVPFKEEQRHRAVSPVVHEETWLKNINSKQTQRTYATAIREICTQLGVTNADEFRALTKDDIIEYRDYLTHDRELSNSSFGVKIRRFSKCNPLNIRVIPQICKNKSDVLRFHYKCRVFCKINFNSNTSVVGKIYKYPVKHGKTNSKT